MGRVRLTVSVAEDRMGDFCEIVEKMRKAGLDVKSALGAAGVATGTIDEAKLDELCRVPGVEAVERQRDVVLAPPRDPVQ